jgi:hypothetical protein
MKPHFRARMLNRECCSVKVIKIIQKNLISSPWSRKYCDIMLYELTISSVGVMRQKQRPRVFNKNLAADLGYALN